MDKKYCIGFPVGAKCLGIKMWGMSNHWCAECNAKREKQLRRRWVLKS